MLGGADVEFADSEVGNGFGGGLDAAQYGAHAGDQFHHAERLGNEVIRTVIETDNSVIFGIFRCEHYNGYVFA